MWCLSTGAISATRGSAASRLSASRRDAGAEHVDPFVTVDIAAAHPGHRGLHGGLFGSDGLLDFLERGLPGLDLHLVHGLASLPERFGVGKNLAHELPVSALDDFPPELARSLGPFVDGLLRLVLQDDEHRSVADGGRFLSQQHGSHRREQGDRRQAKGYCRDHNPVRTA